MYIEANFNINFKNHSMDDKAEYNIIKYFYFIDQQLDSDIKFTKLELFIKNNISFLSNNIITLFEILKTVIYFTKEREYLITSQNKSDIFNLQKIFNFLKLEAIESISRDEYSYIVLAAIEKVIKFYKLSFIRLSNYIYQSNSSIDLIPLDYVINLPSYSNNSCYCDSSLVALFLNNSLFDYLFSFDKIEDIRWKYFGIFELESNANMLYQEINTRNVNANDIMQTRDSMRIFVKNMRKSENEYNNSFVEYLRNVMGKYKYLKYGEQSDIIEFIESLFSFFLCSKVFYFFLKKNFLFSFNHKGKNLMIETTLLTRPGFIIINVNNNATLQETWNSYFFKQISSSLQIYLRDDDLEAFSEFTNKLTIDPNALIKIESIRSIFMVQEVLLFAIDRRSDMKFNQNIKIGITDVLYIEVNKKICVYDLISIICYSGNSQNGHYNVYLKDQTIDDLNWYKYDDNIKKLNQVNKSKVFEDASSKGYVFILKYAYTQNH